MKLSIIIPVYNEENTIESLLKSVLNEATEKEIIIVDDGSTDNTYPILNSFSNYPAITILRHKTNQGKGAAIKTALPHIKNDYTLIQDADLEYSPNDYNQLIEPVISQTAQIVYGSRFKGTIHNMTIANRVANKLFTRLLNLLYHATISDMATCYKLIPTGLLRKLMLFSDGFGIDAEITAKILTLNLLIHEVPVQYNARKLADGKKINWYHSFIIISTLLRIKAYKTKTITK